MDGKPSNTVVCNLVVIRSQDIHRAVEFYKCLGLKFVLHSHGKGPEHFAAEMPGFVFEIYPEQKDPKPTIGVRIGFRLSEQELEQVVDSLAKLGSPVISKPKDSEWGRRAVVRDFDGHTIELLTVT